ncbi:MAG: immunoglobulin domain-containing protein [Verrucomicrobiae bacterium]|nr:immunoglobulin domain-containing protein [Verrucomicrobiae bacterium]
MKTIKLFLCLVLAMLVPRFASALIVGPYTPDASTLHLWHLDEATTPALDAAANGTNLTALSGGATLNNASFTGFGTALSTVAQTNAVITPIGVATNEAIAYEGAGGAFTYEAVVHIEFDPTSNFVARAQAFNILNYDGNGAVATRAFIFRIDPVGFQAGTGDTSSNACRLEFIRINSSPWLLAPIPTNGPDAIVSNGWYHVAVTYNGTPNTTSNLLFYWTAMDASRGQAGLIYGTNLTANLQSVTASLLTIGNSGRNPGGGAASPLKANFPGKIDEVRMSSVARAASQMMFAPATVTIVQQPIGQEGVDYGGTGSLSVSASSALTMGYQWRQGNVPVAGATNATFVFTNASAANAGNYTCVITNLNASSITSSVASVVIGAANFLTNRYSFTTDASDSIGGQNGTVVGGATFNGNGTLTLDGSSGFVQLPVNMINTNMGAITLETWVSFGTIAVNAQLFAFGNTNGNSGYNYIFATPHGAVARMAITAGNYTTEQGAAAGSALDNYNNVQVVAVFAPYAGTETFYTNGVLAAINTNVTLPLAVVIDNFSYLGHSLYSGDPFLACTLDEFRVYDGALSAASVKQSYLQGSSTILSDGPVQFLTSPANASVAQGLPVTFSSFTEGHQPVVYQWFKNSVAISGATNASYTYSPSFADNNASFQVRATNNIGGTNYSASSGTATLTVSVPETLAWLGASDNGWNLSSLNWSNSAQALVAYAQYDGAVFDDRGTTQPNIDLQFPVTPVALTVSNTAADYSIGSASANGSLGVIGVLTKQGSGKLTLDVTNNSTGPVTVQSGTLQIGAGDTLGSLGTGPVTNNGTLSFDRSDGIGVANDLHGTGTVSYDGSGSVTLTSTNVDYTGSTVINNGRVFLATSSGLGATNSGTTVNSGGQIYITANVNLAEELTLSGSGDGNGAVRKGAAGLTVETAPVALAADSTIGLDNGATLTLSNTVSGAAALTVVGNGTLTLNTNNTFTGGLTLNGAVVGLNANGALGPAATATVSGVGRFVLGTGVTITNAINATTVSPGVATGLIMVNDNTNGTVTTVSGPLSFATAPANGGDFVGPTISGYLSVLGSISAPGVVTSVRFGNVRFAGGGSYQEMQVRANTTSIGADNGVATSAVMDIGGNGSPTVPTYFDLNGYNQQLAGLKNTVTPANLGIVTNSGATVKTLTLDLGAGNSLSFSGGVAGKVALVFDSGTENFTGTNTYTGNTTINGGTLELATPSLATNSTVTVASGAILQLDFPVTNTVGVLVLAGASQSPGVYNSTTSPSFIAGSGSLLVVPPVNPTPTNLTAVVNAGKLELSWPADHIGWRLQVQTNSLATGLYTNWVDVPGANTVNSVTNALNPANGAVFYRMIYP